MPYVKQRPKSYIQYHNEAIRLFSGYISKSHLEGLDVKDLLEKYQMNQLMKVFNGVVSILDFSTQGYLFMSENVKDLVGHPPEEFYKLGIQKTISLIPKNHLDIIHDQIFPIMFDHFDRCSSPDEVKDLRVSFNYNLCREDGSIGSCLQQLSVIYCDEFNKARIAVMLVTDMSDFKKDNSITLGISKRESNGVYYPIFTKSFLSDFDHDILTSRELEILNLVSQGKSSTEISEMLYISKHTVYNHRKNMLKKMDAKNTGELLSKSMSLGFV